MSKLENNSDFSFIDIKNYNDNRSEIEEENTLHNAPPEESLSWDTFKCSSVKKQSASMQNKKWLNIFIQITKVFVYGFLFCFVLCTGVITRFVVLFAVSQLKDEKSTQFCDYHKDYYNQKLMARISTKGKIIWTWCIIFMFLVPECLTIFHAIWYFLFKKKVKLPTKQSIAILFTLETLHPISLAILFFYSLPKLNSMDAAAVSSCICIIPTLLNIFTQRNTNTNCMSILILGCNILALIAQCSGTILQSYFNYTEDPLSWILFIALVFSSCRWWCNYTTHSNYCGFLNVLAKTKIDLMNKCHILQGYIAFWRCLVFISSVIVISFIKGIEIQQFFEFMWQSEYDVKLIKMPEVSFTANASLSNFDRKNNVVDIILDTSTVQYIFLVQAFCAFFIYEAATIAYQTRMHKFGFALPISLVTPGIIILTIVFSFAKEKDSCAFHHLIPDYLFLNLPKYNSTTEFFLSWRIWCWMVWWLSQIWITIQLWPGENERLNSTEKIFYHSSYDSFLIDQFLGLNKRRHKNYHQGSHEVISKKEEFSNYVNEFEASYSEKIQDLNNLTLPQNTRSTEKNTCVSQIYVCATMWHEDKDEMNELVGSILRLDKDQCAMKVTQKYYKISIKDYYELETHVIFDDAFCCMYGCTGSCNHNENETQVNEYVITFVETMQRNIENLGIRYVPPIKCPTPYGGQLVWNLPGKTHLTVHLKNKNQIRHRKRWSQVMYMYYLLGYRLMGSPIDIDTKELVAQNTYILTLDGDVDFRPAAVKALIDLMKKDKELGAACGRIHPIGKGPIIWFQKFEYAVGHWLQKSTEHTLGSVLCSPGCFSLFRAKALMQHNVVAKYATKSTEPKHYIQYDQGEDRWLCTLILQAGCKVEYCAASDAYTHAPQSFKEFYIQRRRWIPSTMANIFDLLDTSKDVRKVNDNISWLYVAYQWVLTGSTVIGPSFIYLMMVGAFVTSFQLDNWLSFWYNSIPIIIFILVCFFGNVRIQLITAEIITIIYGLVMMVVLVGIILQIAADGYFAPNTLLFLIIVAQFVATAFMHPQEISCLPNAVVYYITVPSMYMLLIIFSIFNVHNITWGTRETTSQKQLSEQQSTNTNSEQQDQTATNKWAKYSLPNLFRCNCYAYKNSEKEEKYLQHIYDSINEINLRLKQIESNIELSNITKDNIEEKSNNQSKTNSEYIKIQFSEYPDTSTDSETDPSRQDSTSNMSEQQNDTNYLINPQWVQDERLKNGKVDFLSFAEEEFWRQLIKKYLHPIETDAKKQQKIAKGLINIRNECLLNFFMINILFIVSIFLLQINKDILYLKWPFAIEYVITYNEDNEVNVSRNYMHLEPIGCLFIVAFVFILFIQFIAMLSHRFNTFVHVLANAKLRLFCFNKKKDYSTNDIITSTHAQNIAEGLQNAIEYQSIFNIKNKDRSSLRKRKTVRELIEDTQNPPSRPSNFEILFHERLREPDKSGFSKAISKDVIEAFEKRRSNIIAQHNRLQSKNNIDKNTKSNESPKHVYDNPVFLNDDNE